MAITITKQPAGLAPVYNENYIRLIDSVASMSDYKYIVRLYQKQTTAASYSLVGTFTQFPLQDGTLEFDPMSILCNYVNNGNYDYSVGSYSYRSSLFQYKVIVSRTYAGAAEAVIYAFDQLYAFDAALSQAEFDVLNSILTVKNPVIETTTYNSTWYSTDILNQVAFLLTDNGDGFSGSFVFTAGFGYAPNNGWHMILSKQQVVGNVYLIQTDLIDMGTVSGTIKFYGAETSDNRSISNCPTELQLSEFDYYTADFFKYMPTWTTVTTGTWRNVGIEVHTSTGWRWYNTVLNPGDNSNIEQDILTLGIGPMNIKAGTWLGIEGTVSGQTIFDNFDFTEYRVYMNVAFTQIGVTDYPTLMKPITVNFCRSASIRNTKNFDRTWLVYKSKLGGWSYLSFNMKSQKKQDTKQVTYNRRLKYNETYKQRGTTVISNSVAQSYVLNTDWVSTDEWTYYEDLFSSPQVFMLRPTINKEANTTDPFLPCVVKTTNTPIYSPNNDKLFQYTIEIETANQNIRQRK